MLFLKLFYFLTTGDSHGTLHLALGLVAMYSPDASILVARKFSYSSFRVCVSDIS